MKPCEHRAGCCPEDHEAEAWRHKDEQAETDWRRRKLRHAVALVIEHPQGGAIGRNEECLDAEALGLVRCLCRQAKRWEVTPAGLAFTARSAEEAALREKGVLSAT